MTPDIPLQTRADTSVTLQNTGRTSLLGLITRNLLVTSLQEALVLRYRPWSFASLMSSTVQMSANSLSAGR
jgi:hypothetical protein